MKNNMWNKSDLPTLSNTEQMMLFIDWYDQLVGSETKRNEINSNWVVIFLRRVLLLLPLKTCQELDVIQLVSEYNDFYTSSYPEWAKTEINEMVLCELRNTEREYITYCVEHFVQKYKTEGI